MKAQTKGRYDKLEASLQATRREVDPGKPRAALVVTAHWEEPAFTVSSGAAPGMIYDYYNFPPHTYEITYAAPGSPELASRVQDLLVAGGLPAREDPQRGFDHGTFSLMQPLYPEERLPIVQLSLKAGLDPAEHLAAGRLLAPLRDEGVLILGSGSSWHNLRRFDASAAEPSRLFDDWLAETLEGAAPGARSRRLAAWERAPAARDAHPREEHLIPLMTVVGAAEAEPGGRTYHQDDFAGGISVSSFRFGAAPAR
jgi:aromatic ring-opening dioxygenase catalytic subunit (LigB family)